MKGNEESSDDLVVLRITETALREFQENGKVISARCNVCGGLIELNWLGDKRTAVSIKCSCGKFHGALKGLLN
jgi:hypothetical protein